ncbi:unnamed protein product, partial [Ectocarpus sp. 6 AP-2014]
MLSPPPAFERCLQAATNALPMGRRTTITSASRGTSATANCTYNQRAVVHGAVRSGNEAVPPSLLTSAYHPPALGRERARCFHTKLGCQQCPPIARETNFEAHYIWHHGVVLVTRFDPPLAIPPTSRCAL